MIGPRTVALALLTLAAGPAAAAEPPPDPGAAPAIALVRERLAGCEAQGHPGGVRFQCDQLVVTAADLRRGGTGLEALARAAVAGIGAGGDLQMSSTEEVLRRDGIAWPVLHVEGREPGKQAVVFEARLLMLLLRGGRARQVLCGAPPERPDRAALCDELIPALARAGPEPFAPPRLAPAVGGREVQVPPGCEIVSSSASGFQLRCGETANLSYLRLDDEAQAARVLDMLADQVQRALPALRPGPPRDCHIGGVATTCRTLAGQGALFVLGRAVVDGAPGVVQCVQEARTPGTHPVCQPVVTF